MDNYTIFRAYPIASIAAATTWPGLHNFHATANILDAAVQELGNLDNRRMLHVRGVEMGLNALAEKDFAFFYDHLSVDLKCDRSAYFQALSTLHGLYQQLKPVEKEILKLAVLAHDLGVPLGKEWDHLQNSRLVVNKLVTVPEYRGAVGALVGNHGHFSNLIASSFPRDIYQVPRQLIPLLLLLDFCDASSRAKPNKSLENPIGLESLAYYTRLSVPADLTLLENAENLFNLRCQYGFGIIVSRRTLSREDILAIKAIPNAINFLGAILRCRFLDILLFSFETPQERSQLISAVMDVYNKNFSGSNDIWLEPDPEADLGRIIKQDLADFIRRIKAYYQEHGLQPLFIPDSQRIIFKTSSLGYHE